MPRPIKSLAEVHALLGSEARLGIVLALAGGPMNVSELASKLQMGFSAASQHLAKLRAADIVDYKRDAQTVIYRLAEPRHPAVENTLQILGKGAS